MRGGCVDQAWQAHLDALNRFNDWEVRRLRERPANYSAALNWLSEAWDLAATYSPVRSLPDRRAQHLEELKQLWEALERADLKV